MARPKKTAASTRPPGDPPNSVTADDDTQVRTPNIRNEVLNSECQELRDKLIRHLKDSPDTHDILTEIAEPYGPAVCQKVLPMIIGGVLEKSKAQQKRATIIRRAVQSLQTEHHFEFVWNEAYQCFFEERISTPPKAVDSLEVITRVFGDNWEKDLGLNDGPSKVKYLKPLATTCEALNLDLDVVKGSLSELRDQRVKRGKQGTSRSVIIADITNLNKQLSHLIWDDAEVPKVKDLAKKVNRGAKRRKVVDPGKTGVCWDLCKD